MVSIIAYLFAYLLGFTVQVIRFSHHISLIEIKILEETKIKNPKKVSLIVYLTVQFLFWWLFVIIDWLQDLGLIKSKN